MAQYINSGNTDISADEIRENFERHLIAKEVERGDLARAAFSRRIMLLVLDVKRRCDNGFKGVSLAEIQPWYDLLTNMMVLADEREPAYCRVKAAEDILNEHIKRPLFPPRFKLVEDELRSLPLRIANLQRRNVTTTP